MLQIKIRELCEQRGITTAYQLQKAANLAPSTAARLFDNAVKQFTPQTLGKLCAGLKCTPNDFLITIQPTPHKAKRKTAG